MFNVNVCALNTVCAVWLSKKQIANISRYMHVYAFMHTALAGNTWQTFNNSATINRVHNKHTVRIFRGAQSHGERCTDSSARMGIREA